MSRPIGQVIRELKRYWPVRYAINVLLAADQLLNALCLGDPDESMSSRMGKVLRKYPDWWASHLVCWLLDLIEPGHCAGAIEDDEGDDAIIQP